MPTSLPRLWTDASLHPAAVAVLRGHVQLSGPHVPANEAAASPFGMAGADAVMAGPRGFYNAASFASAPALKVIARTGIGYDNIDLSAATAAGVCVVNTPDAPTESTAEFALTLMFAVSRRVATADLNSKAGLWKQDATVLGFELADKNLGLVGFGRIARRVAEVARALRMRVHAFDPFVPAAQMSAVGVTACATLPDLLRISQVLSLHAPSTADTRRLIGAGQLALLPAGAILINTARGPLIDDLAVLAALNEGRLAGAGIDVWETEPVAPDHPLFRHPRVVATPHIAAYTEEARYRSHVAAAELILMALSGEPPATLIDPSVWPRRRR